MITLATALNETTQRLQKTSDSARLDAELLLCHSLGLSRTQLFTRDDETLSASSLENCEQLIQRREQGEPLAYIIGIREFWSMELSVNQHTLIPRPETELLVKLALQHIDQEPAFHIADLGTGSGAIALAIAKERNNSHIDACDISTDALAIAKHNARKHDITNVAFQHSDWFKSLQQKQYELIVSNPPYVAPNDIHLQQGDVRFEPATALSAANDGYADLYTIAEHAISHLKPGGHLLLEHGFEQQEKLMAQLRALGYSQINAHNDYAQKPRAVSAQWIN